MRALIECLVGLVLASKVEGQTAYYTKPSQRKSMAYIGVTEQILNPVLPSDETLLWKGVGTNLQVGVTYNMAISKNFSTNLELAFRQNSANLTTMTSQQDTYFQRVTGFSTQLLLPLEWTMIATKSGKIGVSTGLFIELPVSMRLKKDRLTWITANTTLCQPISDVPIHSTGQGWQMALDYYEARLAVRLLVANRSLMGIVPATRSVGFTVGVNF